MGEAAEAQTFIVWRPEHDESFQKALEDECGAVVELTRDRREQLGIYGQERLTKTAFLERYASYRFFRDDYPTKTVWMVSEIKAKGPDDPKCLLATAYGSESLHMEITPHEMEVPEVLTPEEQQRRGRWCIAAKYTLRPGTRVLVVKDRGQGSLLTVTTSAPWLMGGHTWVVTVEGISGGYCLDRVFLDSRQEYERRRDMDAREP
jgi:hypothetical protein